MQKLGLMLMLAAAGCGSEGSSSRDPGNVAGDGAAGQSAGADASASYGAEASVQSDTWPVQGDMWIAPANDGSDKGQPAGDNCQAISLCTESCCKGCNGNFTCMLKCNTDCAAKGCASAKTLFTAVNNCGQAKCMFQCMSGPNTCP